MIIWVTGVLRMAVVGNWRFDNLCRSHLQSDLTLAVLKWILKVIKQLRLLLLMIASTISLQFFSHWDAKPTALCTHDLSRVLSKLQVITVNSNWFIALFARVVIGQGYYAPNVSCVIFLGRWFYSCQLVWCDKFTCSLPRRRKTTVSLETLPSDGGKQLAIIHKACWLPFANQ